MTIFKANLKTDEILVLEGLDNAWKSGSNKVTITKKSGEETYLCYDNETQRDEDYEKLVNALSELKGGPVSDSNTNPLKTVIGDVKGFVKEHRSTLYIIAIVFLVDHLVFEGAFRGRLKGLVDKLLNKAESSIAGVVGNNGNQA